MLQHRAQGFGCARQAPRGAPRRVGAAAAVQLPENLGLSALRFVKPTLAEIEALVEGEFKGRELNHPHAGASATAPDLPPAVATGGFMLTSNRRRIGTGKAAYDSAVNAVKRWEQLQLSWNFTTTPAVEAGARICSATQTVVPWSVLPAQVVYAREEAAEFGPSDKGSRFAVGLASLSGHLLAGEERFAVEQHADGSVWFEVFLFSKPNTLLAWLSLPVIKLMQIRYVNDAITAVEASIK